MKLLCDERSEAIQDMKEERRIEERLTLCRREVDGRVTAGGEPKRLCTIDRMSSALGDLPCARITAYLTDPCC